MGNRELAVRYRVMGMPALVFFCGGGSVEYVVGFMPKEYLKKIIDNVIGKHRECILTK